MLPVNCIFLGQSQVVCFNLGFVFVHVHVAAVCDLEGHLRKKKKEGHAGRILGGG